MRDWSLDARHHRSASVPGRELGAVTLTPGRHGLSRQWLLVGGPDGFRPSGDDEAALEESVDLVGFDP